MKSTTLLETLPELSCPEFSRKAAGCCSALVCYSPHTSQFCIRHFPKALWSRNIRNIRSAVVPLVGRNTTLSPCAQKGHTLSPPGLCCYLSHRYNALFGRSFAAYSYWRGGRPQPQRGALLEEKVLLSRGNRPTTHQNME